MYMGVGAAARCARRGVGSLGCWGVDWARRGSAGRGGAGVVWGVLQRVQIAAVHMQLAMMGRERRGIWQAGGRGLGGVCGACRSCGLVARRRAGLARRALTISRVRNPLRSFLLSAVHNSEKKWGSISFPRGRICDYHICKLCLIWSDQYLIWVMWLTCHTWALAKVSAVCVHPRVALVTPLLWTIGGAVAGVRRRRRRGCGVAALARRRRRRSAGAAVVVRPQGRSGGSAAAWTLWPNRGGAVALARRRWRGSIGVGAVAR